jgi:hypothetical protein
VRLVVSLACADRFVEVDTVLTRALAVGCAAGITPVRFEAASTSTISDLEVTATRARGCWERRGYPAEAPIP